MITTKEIFKQLQWGFEIECYLLDDEKKSQFKRNLNKLCGGIIITDDGSLDSDFSVKNENTGNIITSSEGIEIITPPLPSDKAFVLLDKIFKKMNGICKTDETCGLHVNVSFKDQEKWRDFVPHLFCYHPIWKKLTEDFGREDNSYCQTEINSKPNFYSFASNFLNDNYFIEKSYCVGLDNYERARKYSRIEIRGFGNEGYEKKYGLIMKYIEKIAKLMYITHPTINTNI